MRTFAPTFTGNEDRARVLTEILRGRLAVSGVTLIALIDRSTHDVLAVRSLPTPEPVLDADGDFDGEFRCRLSADLREVACDLAPRRRWTGAQWSAITSELVTVVCRGGTPEITATEAQFFWGWRFSNHLTEALDGDVYVVTPHGWANLSPEFSGASPALPADADALDTEPGVREAVLADASLALLGPEPRECLVCYVHRMLMEFGCDCRLRFAAHYRDVRAPRATGLERTWPTPLPACRGVRAGSTQPCALWWRLQRW